MRTPPRLRVALALCAALGVLALGLVLLFRVPGPPPPGGRVVTSLLAVGDTGVAEGPLGLGSALAAVGAAMAREDRREPVDALVLLGDNFYPDGLETDAMVSQIRECVVRPFCRFVALSGPEASAVSDACRGARPQPPRLLAVLGNHDHKSPESPRLQREAVPRYVSNWEVPSGRVAVRTLPGGVGLVLLDSTALLETDGRREVREAIAAAPGPWRILVSHHPIAAADGDEDANFFEARFRRRLRDVLERSEGAVQLVLSGHHHNLQLVDPGFAGAPLQVVAGSGAEVREVEVDGGDGPGRTRFADAEPGFVRVDLVEDARGQRLVVSLFEVPPVALAAPLYRVATRLSLERVRASAAHVAEAG